VRVIRQEGIEAVVFDLQFECGPARFSTLATSLRHTLKRRVEALGPGGNNTVA
jgi:hypothetical protein